MKQTEGSALQEFVADLVQFQDQLGLTDWEKDFVSDMGRYSHDALARLSLKQKQKIIDLAEKYL